MEVLDGDHVPLVSSNGNKRMRDLVQFVAFSKYNNDEKALASEVLAEIPKQIVEYYKFKNLNPNQILQIMAPNYQFNNNNSYQNNYNYDNNNVNNNEYPSFEQVQKKSEIDLNNIPVNETVYINPNNIQ